MSSLNRHMLVGSSKLNPKRSLNWEELLDQFSYSTQKKKCKIQKISDEISTQTIDMTNIDNYPYAETNIPASKDPDPPILDTGYKKIESCVITPEKKQITSQIEYPDFYGDLYKTHSEVNQKNGNTTFSPDQYFEFLEKSPLKAVILKAIEKSNTNAYSAQDNSKVCFAYFIRKLLRDLHK